MTSSSRADKVILTYDNRYNTDGAGAQLQRIYGTYAISKLVGASYLHSPLRRVDYQGFSALERNVTDPGYHRRFNDLFQIPSDVVSGGDFHQVELPNIYMETPDQFVEMFDSGATNGKPILALLQVPYGIADQFPDCYEVCKEISPFASSARAGCAVRVAIHVRRGELLVVESQRMLPNTYYVSVARDVMRALEALGIEYQLELHTEVAAGEFVVQPGYPGIPERVAQTVITPDMCRLDEFDVLPNLVRFLNDTAIDCLRKLATADILIMSRSSFSYVAAILNRTGIMLYHPFWHSPLSSWLPVEPHGQFDRSRFGQALVTSHGVA